MTAMPRRKHATYADLAALPAGMVGEILFGSLEAQPRPAPRHSVTSLELGTELNGPFRRGIGGPGGWLFASEPELHLGADVLVPDLAGWRRERLPSLPETAWFESAPDWICEVISPSTARLDRGPKREIYAREGVGHLWLLDPIERYLEVFALAGVSWLLASTHFSGDEVRAAPFDAIAFPLDNLFPFDAPAGEGAQ